MSLKSEKGVILEIIKTKEEERHDIYNNSGKTFDATFIKT